jgi:hypothetical protein
MKYGWLTKIEWKGKLKGDFLAVAELIGIENFIRLMETFQKTAVYFSTAPLEPLFKQYILRSDDMSTKDLARETGASERTIQKFRKKSQSASTRR